MYLFLNRENAKKLMLENDALQTQMFQTERDTIDVITFLKKQDHDKDSQVRIKVFSILNFV